MGVLNQYGQSALKYWGAILQSAYNHSSIADMWTSIRAQQEQYGLAKPGTSAPDVMVLRGYANRIANGAAALDAANPTDTITPAMLATAPYTAQDAAGIATNPTYFVRYQNTVQAADGTTTQVWATSVYTASQMPGTVGELMDSISGDASELALGGVEGSTTTPRGTSLGVDSVEITVA